MRRQSVRGAWAVLGLLLLGCSEESVSPTAPGPSLARTSSSGITHLPTLGGFAEVFAINDAGVAVGYSVLASGPGYQYAVRWAESNGTWTVTQIGGRGTRAYAVNAAGTIVGDSVYFAVGDAVVWFPGQARQVIGRGEANGVNDANVVVGFHWEVGSHVPAAWRQGGGVWVPTLLELPPGTTAICNNLPWGAQATAISNAGVIVGFIFAADCSRHYAVKWVPRANPADGWEPAELLEDVANMTRSYAYGIDGNTIVGEAWPCAELAGCTRRAWRWSLTAGSSETGPIGTLDARANGLNAAGTAVGSYLDGNKMRAVMWQPGSSAFVTLPALNGFGKHWVWDINNATAERNARFAVGGALSERGGMTALVWKID